MECFGFYGGQRGICVRCALQKKCKALLVSHGFDILNAALQSKLENLPDGSYNDTDRISEVTLQIMEGPKNIELNVDEEELSSLLGTNKKDTIAALTRFVR